MEQYISCTGGHKYTRHVRALPCKLWRVWNFSLTIVLLMLCQEGGMRTTTKKSSVHLSFGVQRSFYPCWHGWCFLWLSGSNSIGFWKNMDRTDVKIKCNQTRAQLCQGSSSMPTLNQPFQACLSVQRRAAPFPVYACAEFHIRELASSGRFFRTPQEIFSLKWLIIYHLSKPLEFR